LNIPYFDFSHNPENYEDPEEFKPERFLSADGKSLMKVDKNFVPFSVGKRLCIGEGIARDTIFLFMTSIFQKFEALPTPGEQYSLEPISNMDILEPRKFTVILKEREGFKC